MGEELKRRLDGAARRHGQTLFTAALAAYHVLLRHLCGQTDVVISAPLSGRQHGGSEGVIGFFVDTLLLRTNSARVATFAELLARVGADTAADFAHQDLPLDQVIAELAPARTAGSAPLLQVGINLLDQGFLAAAEVPGLALSPFEIEPGYAQFELNLILIDTPHGLDGEVPVPLRPLRAADDRPLGGELPRARARDRGASPDVPLAELVRQLARREEQSRRGRHESPPPPRWAPRAAHGARPSPWRRRERAMT